MKLSRKAQKNKDACLKRIMDCDAMKSHKKFVYACIKDFDMNQLSWFFWQAFILWEGKRRASASELFYCLNRRQQRAMDIY